MHVTPKLNARTRAFARAVTRADLSPPNSQGKSLECLQRYGFVLNETLTVESFPAHNRTYRNVMPNTCRNVTSLI